MYPSNNYSTDGAIVNGDPADGRSLLSPGTKGRRRYEQPSFTSAEITECIRAGPGKVVHGGYGHHGEELVSQRPARMVPGELPVRLRFIEIRLPDPGGMISRLQ